MSDEMEAPGLPEKSWKASYEMTEELKKAERPRERLQWSNSRESIFTMLSYVIGLGNVHRFPYYCGLHGGAAFVLAYFILLIFVGLPLFYLELALGQFASLTPPLLFRQMVPALAGLGYSMVVVIFVSNITYGVNLSHSLRYFFMSLYGMSGDVPWAKCGFEWNTDKCFDINVAYKCNTTSQIYFRGQCLPLKSMQPDKLAYIRNLTHVIHEETPSYEYMHRRVLQQSAGFHDFGYPSWDGTLALFFSWLLILVICSNSIKTIGKIAYFTALFPYVVLVAFVVQGNLLDGSGDGLMYFLKPNFTHMRNTDMWLDAASQVVYSLSLGEGGLITLASYNKFNHNLLRDVLIVVFTDAATSILAGFAVFPILGNIAKQTYPNKDARERVELFAQSGTTLTFIAFPNALSRLSASWFNSILFFLMMITIGIGPQLGSAELIAGSVMDQWPRMRRHRVSIVGCYCVLAFLIGLLFVAPGGVYLLTLFEEYANGLGLLVLVLLEVVIVCFVYGVRRLVCNLRTMMGNPSNFFWRLLGYPVNPYWWICWISITPLMLLTVIVASFVQRKALKEGDYVFPWGAEFAGGWLSLVCFGWIPGMIIFKVVRSKIKNEAFMWLLRPTDAWGPREPLNRARVERDERAVRVRKG